MIRSTLICLLLAATFAFGQRPALTIAPTVITQCVSGRGRAVLTWNSAGPGLVQIRIGDAQGIATTGREAPMGSTETGDWVSNGMVFVLVNESGAELARATANVSCGASADPRDAALASGPYLPLQVGNQWVYRYDTRFATANYIVRTIVRTEQRGDRTYFVQASRSEEVLLRSDSAGRVFLLLPSAAGKEELWLDPTAAPDPSAVLKIRQRNAKYKSALGTFQDALVYDTGGFILESGTFVRGLGFVESSATMQSGSSGGFTDGYQLVYARIGSSLRIGVPGPSIQLGAESTQLDVGKKKVSNCAIPCYFVACGLGSPVDPPNTYKPCFQARMNVQRPADGSTLTAEVELRDPAGRLLFGTTVRIPGDDFTFYQQVPLYANPNEPFPPGNYRLNGRLKRNGDEAGSSSLAIQID